LPSFNDFEMGKMKNWSPCSKSKAIHCQGFHQQVEIFAMIRKKFIWEIGTHLIANLEQRHQ